VPYLPIDPKDLGRSYEAIIRINSQSGKGGVAYLLKTDHGLDLPRLLQVEFSGIVQGMTDRTGKEASAADIWQLFRATYLDGAAIQLVDYEMLPDARSGRHLIATIRRNGAESRIEGRGNGPIDAFIDALRRHCGLAVEFLDYREHAVASGSAAQAAAYVQIRAPGGGTLFGVGLDESIVTASLQAVASAAARLEAAG
jgi:2-isopropylmalate synthase